MTFDEWQTNVPDQIRGDTLWRIEAYCFSLPARAFAMVDALQSTINNQQQPEIP